MMKAVEFFAPASDRFQPDPVHTFGNARGYQVSQRTLATIVGLIALLLPFVLLAGVWGGSCFRDSISHFYYARFLGPVVVAALAFIGTFLIAYRGSHPRENLYAFWAGVAAIGVGVFPTSGHGCEAAGRFMARVFVTIQGPDAEGQVIVADPASAAMFQLFPHVETLHYLSAAILFAFLAWYCLRVFTRKIPEVQTRGAKGPLKSSKYYRNLIYYLSGGVIVLATGAMAARGAYGWLFADPPWWNAGNLTFWCEAAALWAFGISWTIKGRLFGTILND